MCPKVEQFEQDGGRIFGSQIQEMGVDCRPYFPPLHLQPFYREIFGYREVDYPNTERAASLTLALPFFNNLTEQQLDYVVEMLNEAINRTA